MLVKNTVLIENWHNIAHKLRSDFFGKINKLGLSKQEFWLLLKIYDLHRENKVVTTTVLSKSLNVTMAAIMHKLSVLENLGMISRIENEDDKRTKCIILSQDIIKKCEAIHRENEILGKEFEEFMGEEDLKMLESLTNKVLLFMEERLND